MIPEYPAHFAAEVGGHLKNRTTVRGDGDRVVLVPVRLGHVFAELFMLKPAVVRSHSRILDIMETRGHVRLWRSLLSSIPPL